MKLQGLDPMTHKPIQPKTLDSATESEEIHQNLEFQETVSLSHLKDYQMQQKTEGSPICVSNQDKIDSCIKNLDMGSSITFQNKEPLGNFSMDPYQNWMDNPFFWDCFTSLEDSFP